MRDSWPEVAEDVAELTGCHAERGNGIARAVDETRDIPESAWRGAFADYRAAMKGTSEAPDSAHFAALWAATGARLRRRVRFFYAFEHFPNVYLVNIGTTGDSKTSAQRQGLRLLPEDQVRVLRGIGSAEALGDWMQASGDVSHFMYLEELGTLLSRGGWEGSTVLGLLTETFDAPDKYEIPFRKKPVSIEQPTPTLLAGTTSEWFWKGMREVDFHGGFGNRILFLAGTPKEPIALPGKPDPVRLGSVKDQLDALDSIGPAECTLTPEARRVWEGFYLGWKAKQRTLDSLLAAATKRIPTYAVKLALVYASLEATVPTITCEQLLAAIKVAEFGFESAERLVSERQHFTAQGRCEAAILRALTTTDSPAWKIHRSIGGRFTADDVAKALKALVTTGAIYIVQKTRRQEPVYGLRGGARDHDRGDGRGFMP